MNSQHTKLLNSICFSRKLSWLDKNIFDEDGNSIQLYSSIIESAYSNYEPVDVERFPDCIFPEDEAEERRVIEQDKWGAYIVNWIDLMVDLDNPLREKVALFWHHHIPCGTGHKFEHVQLLLEIYREFGMGDLRSLLIKIASNPAMLYFLDGHWSHKDNPNENFSRELMELFTLGYGNYSDQDVKEASRSFTGRRFDHDNYPFSLYIDHSAFDNGKKTFLGKTGNWNGEDIIDIILEQELTAKHITKSAYKFFLCDDPEEEVIERAAKVYFNSGFHFKTLLEYIFSGESGYRKISNLEKVKTPVELFVSLRRLTGLKTVGIKTTLNFLNWCGQSLFHPPSVAGWPKGKNMLNGQQLLNRLFLPNLLLKVANRSQPRDSLSYKLASRINDPDIRSFRYYADALFEDDKFFDLLQSNNISICNWLIGIDSESSLEQTLLHPQFQYN